MKETIPQPSFFSRFQRMVRKQPPGNVLFLALFPLAGFLLLEGAARGGPVGLGWWLWHKPLLFLQNGLMVACLYWLLALLRGNRARAVGCVLCTLALFFLGVASYYKMTFRYEPVLLADARQLGDMGNTLQHLDLPIAWGPVLLVTGLCLAGLALCLWRFGGVRPRRGIVWAGDGAALLVVLVACTSLSSPLLGVQTDLVSYAKNGGVLFTAIAVEKKQQQLKNVAYQDEEAKNAFDIASALAQPDGEERPNVLLVLWESFTDQQHLAPYVDFTSTLMPFYEGLQQESLWGDVYVPKIGGGTSESEFEVLTGLESKYAYTPYSFGVPTLKSLAATLGERDYTSTMIHWFTGVFYNRYSNLKNLGFQQMFTTDTTIRPFQKLGQYISDQDHFDAALEVMDSSPGRDFVFCITMQNHGPYGYDDFGTTYGAATPFRTEGLSAEGEKILRNYSYLLTQSDRALEGLITRLRQLEEPTLVVLFGDHIPPFGTEVYQELGMDLSGDAGHLVPYLVWSNQENLAQTRGQHSPQTMRAWQLGAYTLEAAGIHSDPFFHYIDQLRLRGQHVDEQYQLLAYDALFGRQSAYQYARYAIPDEDWQIGGPMVLSGFDAYQEKNTIYLTPRLAAENQACQLYQDGRPVEGWQLSVTDRPFTLQCVMVSPKGRRLNESNLLSYQSTDDLLEKSGQAKQVCVKLSQEAFTLYREERDFYVLESQARFCARVSSVTLGGAVQKRKPHYGIIRTGEYELEPEAYAPVYLSLKKSLLDGYGLTPEGIARCLAAEEAQLTLMGVMGTEP